MALSHNTLALTFGMLGNIISFMVFLAPISTFYRIYKKKSTEGFQSLPYLVALFSSMLWLYYALLKKDAFLLITINSFGCVVETIYIILYIIYAPKHARNLTFKLLSAMNVGSFALILLVTNYAVHGSVRVQVLGWICVTLSVSVFAAPLSIVLPNVLGFGLGLVQMLVYVIYRNRGEKAIKKEKKAPIEPLKSIVVERKVEKVEQENKKNDNDDEKKDKSEDHIACGV
ncbi:hypothetical protein RYX36_000463 [Vicia faba]